MVWVELGGQLERVDSSHTAYLPSSFSGARSAILAPMIQSQEPPAYGFGGEGKVTFAPEASDWIFSAAVRYGRSNGARHLHHQTPGHITYATGKVAPVRYSYFGDGQTEFHESHFILDFQAGRDVGLGLFGSGGSSVVSAGVRIAQFNSNTNIDLHARPYAHFTPNKFFPQFVNKYNRYNYNYTAVAQARRKTQAFGPSLSWEASQPLVHSGAHGMLNFDWGLNASILFGRQRAEVRHQTTAYYQALVWFRGSHPTVTARTVHATHHTRARNVTIPNIGGFAGLSLKFPNAKVALGYRADFFFGAEDDGIDSARKTNVGFYGPFATVSIGVGG